MRFGLQLWSQQTDWAGFRDAALAADDVGLGLGLDVGPPLRDLRPVGAAHLRGLVRPRRPGADHEAGPARPDGRRQHVPQPGLTAKVATTLDHLSDGRAVLGIGAAWFEREHDGFGITFGDTPGWRIDRLDESVMLMRRLLDGERFSHEGKYYTFHDALVAPRPVQAHLPILIGGSGPKKTLRTVARTGRRLEHLRHGRGGRSDARDPRASTARPSGGTSRRSS